MYGSILYPNTSHLLLEKELPGCNIGDVVTIIDADGRECLKINDIEMPIDCAMKHPEWFKHVSYEEHLKNCKNNTVAYLIQKGKSKEQAEKMYEKFLQDENV
jgi:hypothetical protein